MYLWLPILLLLSYYQYLSLPKDHIDKKIEMAARKASAVALETSVVGSLLARASMLWIKMLNIMIFLLKPKKRCPLNPVKNCM